MAKDAVSGGYKSKEIQIDGPRVIAWPLKPKWRTEDTFWRQMIFSPSLVSLAAAFQLSVVKC